LPTTKTAHILVLVNIKGKKKGESRGPSGIQKMLHYVKENVIPGMPIRNVA